MKFPVRIISWEKKIKLLSNSRISQIWLPVNSKSTHIHVAAQHPAGTPQLVEMVSQERLPCSSAADRRNVLGKNGARIFLSATAGIVMFDFAEL